MQTASSERNRSEGVRRSSFKLTYKEAVVGRGGGEKDLERKSIHSVGLSRDEKSIGGAIMNGVRSASRQPLPYIPQQHTPWPKNLPGVKWTGQQNLGSDCNVKIGLAANFEDRSYQCHRGGEGEGKSPPWKGEKRAWPGNTNSHQVGREQRRSIEQGFGGKENASHVTSNDSGSSRSRLTKYVGGAGAGGLSTPVEITEASLPAGCSTIEGTEKNFIPSQNKGSSYMFERIQSEKKSIPVVSAKSLHDLEEKRLSTSSQNVSAGLTRWPTFPNKKTVYFFPKTLSLPHYTFDMVYYQDHGEFGPSANQLTFESCGLVPCYLLASLVVHSHPNS